MLVTANRRETRAGDAVISTDVVEREQIETSGASTVDELLEEQPGVVLQRTFAGTSVRLQGLSPEQVLVLIDGQRVVGRKDGVIDLSRYPVDWIERIEIVKGPSSVLYGSDAMGGVVNIITRRPDGPVSADLYSSYGTLGTLDVAAGVGMEIGRVGTRTHGGYHTADGYDLDPSDLSTDGAASTMLHAGNISQIDITDDWRLTPRVSFRRQDASVVSESGTGAIFDARNLSEELQAALGSDTWLSSQTRLQVTGFTTWYRDQYNSDQRESDALDVYQDTRESLHHGVIQFDHNVQDKHLITTGMELLTESMQSDRLADGKGNRKRFGLFAQDEWTITRKRRFVLMPGARLDIDSQFGTHPTPRVALRYDPHDTVALRAGLGWGYRAPSFKEQLLRFENRSAGYIVEGSPELQPETSRNINLGVEWQPTDPFWAAVSAYRNDVDNLIDFALIGDRVAGSPAQYTYSNVAKAVTQGGELNVAVEPVSGVSIVSGYGLTHTLDVENNRPLEGRPLHRVTGRVAWYIQQSGTLLAVRGAWTGPRPFFQQTDASGSAKRVDSDPYTLLDARVGQHLPIKRVLLRIFVGAENLLDEGEPILLPMAPRNFYAGLAGRFPAAPKNSSRR